MNFIMTGHRGLIGSALIKKLKNEGHKPILTLDKKEERDILDINKFYLHEKADMLIHLAAFCKINKTIEYSGHALRDNVFGTYKVMEFCREKSIPKIVFASSSRILEEEKNPYTASKIYGEELIKGYQQCYEIDYVIVRPSTVYGPFNDLTGRLVDIFILNALTGKELKIFGDENKTLDFTYVDDFLDGFLLAMNCRNREFNIASGKSVNLSWLADYIIGLAGNGTKKFYPKEIAQPQSVELNISEINDLGYKPKICIEEGIRRTFDWYKNNLDGILASRR